MTRFSANRLTPYLFAAPAALVMLLEDVSIWFAHAALVRVKWNTTGVCCASLACTAGVSSVETLSTIRCPSPLGWARAVLEASEEVCAGVPLAGLVRRPASGEVAGSVQVDGAMPLVVTGAPLEQAWPAARSAACGSRRAPTSDRGRRARLGARADPGGGRRRRRPLRRAAGRRSTRWVSLRCGGRFASRQARSPAEAMTPTCLATRASATPSAANSTSPEHVTTRCALVPQCVVVRHPRRRWMPATGRQTHQVV